MSTVPRRRHHPAEDGSKHLEMPLSRASVPSLRAFCRSDSSAFRRLSMGDELTCACLLLCEVRFGTWTGDGNVRYDGDGGERTPLRRCFAALAQLAPGIGRSG